MPALVKDSHIRGVGLLSLMPTGLGGPSHYLGAYKIHGSFKMTALKTEDLRKHAHQKGESSTCNTRLSFYARQGCSLSTVHCFVHVQPDDKLTSIVPLPIQAHFTGQEGHARNLLSII